MPEFPRLRTVDGVELEARRRKYLQIKTVEQADKEYVADRLATRAERTLLFDGALKILDRLRQSGDVHGFKNDLDPWSRQKPTGFGGFGQMYLNQLVKVAPDEAELADLLTRALAPPTGPEGAWDTINEVARYTESVKKAGTPAPKRVPYVLSYFWAMQDPEQWPCLWTSAVKALQAYLGWLEIEDDLGRYYLNYRQIILGLPDAPPDVEHVLLWFENHRFVGLDPALVDRCRRGFDLGSDPTDDQPRYVDDDERASAETNARAMISELHVLGSVLEQEVSDALGRSVKIAKPPLEWKPGRYRGDSWVDWRVTAPNCNSSVRVWVTKDGTAVGLYPGWVRNQWYDEAAKTLAGSIPTGMQFLAVQAGRALMPVGSNHQSGEFVLGRWYPGVTALDRIEIRAEILAAAATLRPAVDLLIAHAAGTEPPEDGGAVTTDELAATVKRFIEDRNYPNEKDAWHRAEREKMAELLSLNELPTADIVELRQIWNTDRYGGPGPQSVLNTTLRDAGPQELESFLERLNELLWGGEPDDVRINRLLDSETHIKGLGESVILKLLAIAHPARYVPIFPYAGDMGKVRLMKLIGLEPPDQSLSRGERHVMANDAIRGRLDQYFPGDPWGQAQFLYWLNRQVDLPTTAWTDVLGQLADDLFVEKSFLEDIVELLREKKQVIFYGPPGTGKTYIARRLAAVLAPNPTERMIVQFHPSTSYEDFFEGYRPEGGADGSLTYRLVPGPLALLAARAAAKPGVEHVMVIDEINRANLPKVLGELLYLLEYREERISTLYRAEEAFELPPDLLFIGTMNTADRSIALVDAALRRRFHFIPFFPDSGPMANLLDNWLDHNKEPEWVAELVRMVNRELIDDLGGPHLQMGPSHFMVTGLNHERIRRIWVYSIFPFIEDQLFGEPDRIRHYTFERVWARFQQESATPDLEASTDTT